VLERMADFYREASRNERRQRMSEIRTLLQLPEGLRIADTGPEIETPPELLVGMLRKVAAEPVSIVTYDEGTRYAGGADQSETRALLRAMERPRGFVESEEIEERAP